jgi:RNA-splicing ligase RtcB
MILRKGAISARLGERVIIPLNMRDGALLGKGKGNPEWNFSAPHGAGRACTRTEAKYAFTVEEFKREMEGIYTTTATEGSIDECPMAYKSPSRIFEFIGETVSDYEVIKPIYNFKSC